MRRRLPPRGEADEEDVMDLDAWCLRLTPRARASAARFFYSRIAAGLLVAWCVCAVAACGRGGDSPGPQDADAEDAAMPPGDSGADGGSFTCEALADPSSCWNVLVDRLYDCVPDEVGELNADRTSCTFSDGTTVEFAQPLPTRIEGPPPFAPDFSVLDPIGEFCGSFFERPNSGRNVIVGYLSSTFIQETGRLVLYCMEQGIRTDVFDASFDEVIDCAFSDGLEVPGWRATLDETSVTIAVVSEGNNHPDTLIECVTGG